MNMFTRKMRMLTAVVLDEDKDKVVKMLLEKGVLDFVHLNALDKDQMKKLSTHKVTMNSQILSDYRVRLEGFFRQSGENLPLLTADDLEKLPDLDTDELRRYLDKFSSSLQDVRNRQQSVNQRLLLEEEMLKYLNEKKGEYIETHVGSVQSRKDDFLNRLSPLGAVTIEDGDNIVVLSLRRDGSKIEEILDKFSFVENPDAKAQNRGSEGVKRELENRIAKDRESLGNLRLEFKDRIDERKDELERYWKSVRLHELAESVESYFSYTKNTTLFSGWVPLDSADEIIDSIKSITNGRCILDIREPEDVERSRIPVSIKSPAFLRPFEHLVNNYGIPEYGSINPTPFTAVAYILMFMLMFADFGQGFVLLLVAIIGKSWYKKHPMAKDGLISRYLCSLLLYLGPASMIGGLLFGSTFGYQIIPALWFDYHGVVNGHGGNGFVNDVYDILGISIKFGIAVISLGLVLNWINLVRKKRYFELIFDKYGLVGGALYAIGVYVGFAFVSSGYRSIEMPVWMSYAIVFLVILIFVKEPVHFVLLKRRGESESVSQLILNTIMESLIEILEIFSGFLANTLSFLRVAGLGIAHVSLMTAFRDMAGMTDILIFQILIMIAGNLLVIVLEGLSAGINSLRLNYYEFFTKYFTGRGLAYSPIGLSGRLRAS